jgi:hypothetical protein
MSFPSGTSSATYMYYFSIHSPSFILIKHHIQVIFTSFYHDTIIPSLLQFRLAGRLLSVFYVRYSYQFKNWQFFCLFFFIDPNSPPHCFGLGCATAVIEHADVFAVLSLHAVFDYIETDDINNIR